MKTQFWNNSMFKGGKFYSVYLSNFAVELRDEENNYFGTARLVCSQRNYIDALDFAQSLACNRSMPLKNYSHFDMRYEY